MNSSTALDPTLTASILATLTPFVVFVLIMVFTRRSARLSAVLSLAAITISFVCALFLCIRHWHLDAPLQYTGRWLVSGDIVVPFGYLLDPTSLLMLVIVALICFLVQVYSLGYMAGDPGFSRYYAFMSLFAWAMLSLTLSPTMLQLYIFWELVGVSSYLLIGFWYEKFSATEAGKKAFVMTRLGDVAFFLGLLMVFVDLGNLNILEMNGQDILTRMSSTRITVSALLIFGGIVGKSAQFPLLTWLPDAMEGPTPVSALLHSATMVAAGVYLFARLFGFFALSPVMMTVCLAIGTISLLLASTMAMVARDIKQVWAYSTISQLGFMLMGLGAGSFFAGTFHLITHAGFKALLFLCAGVLIHHYDTNDMFEIGQKGGRSLKSAMICMIVAAGALSGLPPLSGFFSKELILGRLLDLPNPIWFIAGAVGAFLTAYYTFRLIFIILFPRQKTVTANTEHHGHHDAGGAWAMALVLWLLAGVTVALGFFQDPLLGFLKGALGAGRSLAIGHHGWLPVAACSLAVVGIAVAWFEFSRKKANQVGFVEKWPAVDSLFGNRWYLDHIYRYLLDKWVYGGISRLFAWNDQKVIDRVVDGMGLSTISLGSLLARLHTGLIQYRLMILFAVMAILILYLGFGG